jgi:hypothetical protein
MEETLDEESDSPMQNDLSMNQSKRASPGVGQTHYSGENPTIILVNESFRIACSPG